MKLFRFRSFARFISIYILIKLILYVCTRFFSSLLSLSSPLCLLCFQAEYANKEESKPNSHFNYNFYGSSAFHNYISNRETRNCSFHCRRRLWSLALFAWELCGNARFCLIYLFQFFAQLNLYLHAMYVLDVSD